MYKFIVKVIFGLFALVVVVGISVLAQADETEIFHCCSQLDSVPPCPLPVPNTPTIGTTRVVVLYACSTGVSGNLLPVWWDSIWNVNVQNSVPGLFRDNSRGVYNLLGTPFGADPTHCITSNFSPTAQKDSFFTDIIRKADVFINFANFDADGDYYVDGVLIVIVGTSELAAGLPEFVHIKSAVRSDILRRESRELARQKAQTIWRQVQGGASIDTAAAVHSERVVNELIWGWGAWVPEMGDAPAFLGAVIRAHEKKERLIPPVPVDNDFFIGELLEYIPYDSAKFAAARDSTAQFLLQKRRTDAYNTWIVDLQRKADIEDYRMEVLGANF